jgi:hypothetical protein
VETELNQLKKKLNTLEILSAAHTQTSTRKNQQNKKIKISIWVIQNRDSRFRVDRRSAYLVALRLKKNPIQDHLGLPTPENLTPNSGVGVGLGHFFGSGSGIGTPANAYFKLS